MIYFTLEIEKIKPYVINKCCKLKFQEIINFLYETKRFIDNPAILSQTHRKIRNDRKRSKVVMPQNKDEIDQKRTK